MIWNITDVLSMEGRTETHRTEYEPDTIRYGGSDYPVTEKSPVSLTAVNTGKGRAQITGKINLTLLLACDRCLCDVSYPFSLEFSAAAAAPECEAAASEDEADQCLIGYQINVDDLVSREIMVNWPMKILCRPDCKGICSVCGTDLNTGTCECDTFVPDPRLAAIKDIFNAGKEV